MYDIIVFRSRVFVRPHENDNPAAFKKKTSLRTVLKNLRFWCPKVPLKCGQKAKTGEKILPFQNIRIRADEGLYYPYFTIKLSSLEALNRLVIIYNLSFN